jgi:hypothetical protein
MKIVQRIIDYAVLPLVIFFTCFSPHFAHGRILALESGQHLSWAYGILNGKIPYRDIWMLYGPLQEYSIAFLMKLFGKTLAVQRAYFHIGIILALIVGYFLIRAIIKNRFFTYITTWLLITETVWPFWMSRWGGFRVGFGFLGVLCLVLHNQRKKKWYLCAAGIVTVLAFLNSVEYGVILFGTSMAYLGGRMVMRRAPIKVAFLGMCLYVAGILAVLGPLAFYYHHVGALKEGRRIITQDSMVRYSQNTIRSVSKAQPGKGVPWVERKQVNWATQKLNFIKSLNFKFYLYMFVLMFAGLYLGMRFFRRKFSVGEGTLAIVALFAVGSFAVGLRRFPSPQFSSGLSGAVMLLGYFLHRGTGKICDVIAKLRHKKSTLQDTLSIGNVFTCLVLVLLVWYYVLPTNLAKGITFIRTNWQKYGQRPPGLVPLKVPGAGGAWVPPAQAERIIKVVSYIREHTSPGENIYVFPFEAFYYLFTDRGYPTRFPVAISAGPRKEYEYEVIRDLKKDKTRYIIYGTDSYRIPDTNPIDNERHVRRVVKYVKQAYDTETQIGGTLILRRKE